MTTVYRSLSGRRFDLSALTQDERTFLEEVFALYRTSPPWEEFRREWIRLGRGRLWQADVEVGSPAYRICQDLATRLGVAEGRVAPPDYRDHLADWIEARFESRYAFCKATGVDQGHLSRVLAGKKHMAPGTLAQILETLGVSMDLVDREDLIRRVPNPVLGTSAAERLRELELKTSELRNLAQKLEHTATPEERRALIPEPGLFPEADPLSSFRPLLAAGEAVESVVAKALQVALREQSALARGIAEDADAQLEAAG